MTLPDADILDLPALAHGAVRSRRTDPRVPSAADRPAADRALPWPRTVARSVRRGDANAAWDTLLAQVAHGDVAAFEAFHRETRAFAVRVARNAIGRSALAEEIAQDALLKVWTHAHRFDAREGPAVTWLATIVRNRARDVARHLRPERLLDGESGASALAALVDEADGPSELAERRERLPALRAAVATLGDRDREVLQLHHGDGLAHSEIAATLGEPLGTIKTRLRRAHEKLARMLAPVSTSQDVRAGSGHEGMVATPVAFA